MSDSKTYLLTSDLSAIESEIDLDTVQGRRAMRVASIAAELIRTYECMQESGPDLFDGNPCDAMTQQHYRLINDGYVGLAAFQGFVNYLCRRYDSVLVPDGLEPTVEFMLNWLNVYDKEKGGRS